MNVLSLHHLDAEAHRIAKLRDGLLIVPRCGHRFIDRPQHDRRWLGLLACGASAVITVSTLAALARFVAVL